MLTCFSTTLENIMTKSSLFKPSKISLIITDIYFQDTYYDAVDSLETLGMEEALKSMGKSTCKELQVHDFYYQIH